MPATSPDAYLRQKRSRRKKYKLKRATQPPKPRHTARSYDLEPLAIRKARQKGARRRAAEGRTTPVDRVALRRSTKKQRVAALREEPKAIREARERGAIRRKAGGRTTRLDRIVLEERGRRTATRKLSQESAAVQTARVLGALRRAREGRSKRADAFLMEAHQDRRQAQARKRTRYLLTDEGQEKLLRRERAALEERVSRSPARYGVGTGKLRAAALQRAEAKLAREAVTAGLTDKQVLRAINALRSKSDAPALTVLRQFTRPVSGVAGGTRAAIGGRNPVAGAARGFARNDESFSRVLKDVGAPKWVQTAGGLALDVALDPTTYLTLGAGAPAKVAARGAQQAALKAGAKPADALAVARKVYDQSRYQSRGVQVGARGLPVRAVTRVTRGKGQSTREIRTSGKTTSRLAGQRPRVGGLVHDKKRRAADRVASETLPAHRPKGIHPIDYDQIRQAARRHRGERNRASTVATKRASAVLKFAKKNQITAKGQQRIVFALEADDLSRLKGAERDLAEMIRRDLREIADVEVAAGVREPGALVRGGGPGEAQGYFPRIPKALLDESAPMAGRGGGATGRRLGGSSFQARRDRTALENMPAERRAKYLTDDLASPLALRIGDHRRNLALTQFHDEIAALGPKIKSVEEIEDVGGSLRTVYIREPNGFKRVWKETDSRDDIIRKVEEALRRKKEVRVIPEQTFEEAWKHADRGRGVLSQTNPAGRLFDRAQGVLKTGQTVVNPGYHFTNLLGDSFNARLGGARVSDAKAAVRLLGHQVKTDKLNRDLHQAFVSETTPAVVRGGGKVEVYGANGKLSDAQVVELALKHGAIKMGFAGNELRALTEVSAPRRLPGKAMEGLRAFNEGREDLVRLATFRSALKRGMDPEQAAAHTNRFHFDYGDLTEAERTVARRLIPFYVFMSRNAVLQARSLVESPGRFATVEKTRNTLSEEAGLDRDWATKLQPYIQRQVPFAVPGMGVDGLPIGANLKLPLNDLNLIDPRSWPEEFGQRLSVLAKMPLEQWQEWNFFFRDKVRKKLVPAPEWADDPAIRSLIESATGSKVKQNRDRKTGKMEPAWSWRVDAMMRLLPMSGALANATTPTRTKHGDWRMGLTNYATGPRRFAIDPREAKVAALFTELEELEDELATLKPQVPGHKPGEKWGGKIGKLSKRVREIQAEIAKLDAEAGLVEPRFAKKRAKGKKRRDAYGLSRSRKKDRYSLGAYGGGGSAYE